MTTTPLTIKTDAIQFVNTATEQGVLNGVLTISRDRQRHDLRSYELHWGSGPETVIGSTSQIDSYGSENIGTEAAPHRVFNQPLIHRFDQHAADTTKALIPATATYLLVFATNQSYQKILYASCLLLSQQHLLPPSATLLERRLAAASGRLGKLPVLLDTLWDPSRCPTNLLPWLGWATSADIWFDNPENPQSEALTRRNLIRKSAFVHQHKGTRAAILTALGAIDASITLSEWWEQEPQGYPHTFQLDLLVNSNVAGAGTAELNNKLRRAIEAIKPARSHYTFTISTVQAATLRQAASIQTVSYKRFNLSAVIP